MNLFAKIAFKNILNHWRQSLATIISISAAFLTLCMFQGYLFDVGRLLETISRHRLMLGDAIVEHKDFYTKEGRSEPWKFNIDSKAQFFLTNYLKASQDVDVSVRFLRSQGLMANSKTSLIFVGYGYDIPEGRKMRAERWGWNALYGKPLEDANNEAGIAVGQTMGRLLSCTPDHKRLVSSLVEPASLHPIDFHCDQDQTSVQLSATTVDGMVNAIDGDIVSFIDGGFKEMDSKLTYMSLANAQALLNTHDISFESILLKDEDQGPKFIQDLQKAADEQGLPLRVQSWKDHPIYGETYQRTMGILSIFRNFVVAIILTIATLSVLNTLVKVVKERTREIGTLRSLGFRNKEISFVFAYEAVGLAFIGSFMGAIISIVLSTVINHSGITYKAGMFVEASPLTVGIIPSIYLSAFVFLLILAIVSCLLALQTTLRRKISENLTHE